MSARRPFLSVFAAVAALLVTPTIAAGQPTVQRLVVRVLDPAGTPVANARVIVSTRDARVRGSATTASHGTAEFAALAAEYVVEVSADGFAPAAHIVKVRSPHTIVDLRLAIARVTERVVVTASGDQQAASEVSKSVTVVDRADIDARQKFSVAGAVSTVPGLSSQQLGGPGAFTSVRLRGLRERDTALLVDGVRFRDAASAQGDASAFMGDFFVTNVDRIEVLRGPGSSVHGSHAVGGAVHIITREGRGAPGGKIALMAGGAGFARGTAYAGGSSGGERLRYSAGLSHTRTNGWEPAGWARNTSLQARGDVRVLTSGTVTLRTYLSDAASAVNESPAAIGPLPSSGFIEAVPHVTFRPSVHDPDSTRSSTFGSTLVRFQHRPAARFGYTASFHRLATARTFLDGPRGASPFEPRDTTRSDFEGRVHTFDTRGDLDWSSRHVTTVTYGFERERYVSRSWPEAPSLAWRADLTQDSHTASLQHQVRVDSAQITGGVRATGFSMRRMAFDPAERAPFSGAAFTVPPAAVTADLSASIRIGRSATKVRAHVGSAYRAPALFERARASFDLDGYSVYGDPGLEPERAIAGDAGIDQAFAGGRVLATVTWFRTRLTRVIAFESLEPATDPYGRAFGYRTADGRSVSGLEVAARLNPHAALRVNVAYTFVHADAPAGNRDGLPRASAVPAHQFSASIVQRIARGLRVSFEAEASGDHYFTLFDPVTFASRAYGFSGAVTADLAIGYSLPLNRRRGVELHAAVDNVFDRLYFVQGFRAPGRAARAGATVTF